MSIESYADLQARMSKYLKRADLVDLLPDFIMMGEDYLNDNVFTRARRSSFVSAPNQYLIALPSDWERIIDCWYGGRRLDFFSTSADSNYANGAAFSGAPSAMVNGYQIIGDRLVIGVSQLGLKLQVDYYGTLEPLSDSNTSNWLLEDSPTTYLFASLVEAAAYIRDDARMQLWAQKRDDAIASKLASEEKAKTPEGPLTMRRG